MFRRMMAVLGAAALMFVSWAVIAGPAQAALSYHMYTDDGDPGGLVYFFPDGDAMKLCDIQADGYRTIAYVHNWSKNQYEYSIQAVGDRHCTTVKAAMGQPWNLAEGDCIKVTIVLYDGDSGSSSYEDEAFWRNYNNRLANCG